MTLPKTILKNEITEKYYLRLSSETFEVSKATFEEISLKAIETYGITKCNGYFWDSYVLEPKP